MINSDDLQNALILLKHHVIDAQKNLEQLQGDKDILKSSLSDILEIVENLTTTLPEKLEPAVDNLKEKSTLKTFKEEFKKQ